MKKTIDLSFLPFSAQKDMMELMKRLGWKYLGGQDFDESIMEYFKQCYKEKRNRDFPTNRPKLLSRLRLNCREAKHILSNREQPVPINVQTQITTW